MVSLDKLIPLIPRIRPVQLSPTGLPTPGPGFERVAVTPAVVEDARELDQWTEDPISSARFSSVFGCLDDRMRSTYAGPEGSQTLLGKDMAHQRLGTSSSSTHLRSFLPQIAGSSPMTDNWTIVGQIKNH